MAAFLLPYIPGPGEDVATYVWTHDSGLKLSASLLARLTEAADGRRNGNRTWFVAKLTRVHKKGHKIHGPYDEPADALSANKEVLEAVDDGKPTHRIFGPFITVEDFGPKERLVKGVLLLLTDGKTVYLDGAKYDCVFWTASAVDKFVVPYYVQVTNLEEAEHMRDEFMRDQSIAAIHIPGSEIVDAVVPPTQFQELSPSVPSDATIVGPGVLEDQGPGGGVRVIPV